MSDIQILGLILAVVGGVLLSTVVFVPLLKRKGIKTEQILATAQAGLAAADGVIDGVQAIIPNIPGVDLVDKIIGWATKGVTAAEQLYKVGNVEAGQRKETAVQLVKDYLTAANVEITPDVEKIIDGCVEAAVFALPKTGTEAGQDKQKPLTAVVKVDTAQVAKKIAEKIASEFPGIGNITLEEIDTQIAATQKAFDGATDSEQEEKYRSFLAALNYLRKAKVESEAVAPDTTGAE